MTENQAYRKEKVCCSCKYFRSFMGSAGYCIKQNNNIDDMIDIMDTCRNGKYRYKPVLPEMIKRKINGYMWRIKRIWRKIFQRNDKKEVFVFDEW